MIAAIVILLLAAVALVFVGGVVVMSVYTLVGTVKGAIR